MDIITRGTKPATGVSTYMGGREEFDVPAGKKVNIRYWGPNATDVLDATVPAGKKWRVVIGIEIVETDA